MLQTIFLLGLFVLLGIFILKLAFGILGGVVGLIFWFLLAAIRIALIGLVAYIIIRIFSPDTARKIRRKLSGSA